jgi:hypothetical protein
MAYQVALKGGEIDIVEDADSYQQEGPLTTFFQTRHGGAVIDCWARRVAKLPHRRYCTNSLRRHAASSGVLTHAIDTTSAGRHPRPLFWTC